MQVRKPAEPSKTAKTAKTTQRGARPHADPQPQGVGFLTAMEADGALVGGYLILNAAARPLEFHCTAPVRATRAQEILYGPTLRPFLIGEQIGGALLEKAKMAPRLVVTDTEPMLAARMLQSLPLVCLSDSGEAAVGGYRAAAARGFEADLQCMEATLAELGQELDLWEPFNRIREAVTEAHKSRKAS